MLRFSKARRGGKSLALAKPPAVAIIDGKRNERSSTALRAALVARRAVAGAIAPC
jgi:hypothetical protein